MLAGEAILSGAVRRLIAVTSAVQTKSSKRWSGSTHASYTALPMPGAAPPPRRRRRDAGNVYAGPAVQFEARGGGRPEDMAGPNRLARRRRPEPVPRPHAGDSPGGDPEKPIPEVASSDAPADENVHGSQISAVLERMICSAAGKAAPAA